MRQDIDHIACLILLLASVAVAVSFCLRFFGVLPRGWSRRLSFAAIGGAVFVFGFLFVYEEAIKLHEGLLQALGLTGILKRFIGPGTYLCFVWLMGALFGLGFSRLIGSAEPKDVSVAGLDAEQHDKTTN
jgi:hypothetical protein